MIKQKWMSVSFVFLKGLPAIFLEGLSAVFLAGLPAVFLAEMILFNSMP